MTDGEEYDELAHDVARILDAIFHTREIGPAAQDFKLAKELHRLGYRKQP